MKKITSGHDDESSLVLFLPRLKSATFHCVSHQVLLQCYRSYSSLYRYLMTVLPFYQLSKSYRLHMWANSVEIIINLALKSYFKCAIDIASMWDREHFVSMTSSLLLAVKCYVHQKVILSHFLPWGQINVAFHPFLLIESLNAKFWYISSVCLVVCGVLLSF